MATRSLITRRPAETGTLAFSVAALIAYALGADDEQVVLALAGVLGVLPGIITGIVERRRRT